MRGEIAGNAGGEAAASACLDSAQGPLVALTHPKGNFTLEVSRGSPLEWATAPDVDPRGLVRFSLLAPFLERVGCLRSSASRGSRSCEVLNWSGTVQGRGSSCCSSYRRSELPWSCLLPVCNWLKHGLFNAFMCLLGTGGLCCRWQHAPPHECTPVSADKDG